MTRSWPSSPCSWSVITSDRIIRYIGMQKAEAVCSPLTGVTSNSWDTPAGHRVYDACRGFSVSWVCRGSGASIVSFTFC